MLNGLCYSVHLNSVDEFLNAVFERITSNKAFAEFKVTSCVLRCCVDAKSFFFLASYLNSSFNDSQLTFPLGHERKMNKLKHKLKRKVERKKKLLKNNETSRI